MRKLLVVFLIAALAVALAACSNSNSNSKPRDNNLQRILCLSPSEVRLN